MYEEFDLENMFGAIWDFPENLVDALKLGNEITLSQSYIEIQNIVVAGMGGSGAIGDIISAILSRENIHVSNVKGYLLPKTVDKKTLVIATSISGNTKETLSILDYKSKSDAKFVQSLAPSSVDLFT